MPNKIQNVLSYVKKKVTKKDKDDDSTINDKAYAEAQAEIKREFARTYLRKNSNSNSNSNTDTVRNIYQPSTFETIMDWTSWTADQAVRIYDLLVPLGSYFTDYEAVDPVDRATLEEQKRHKDLRDKINRERATRRQIIRENRKADIARAQQKNKICTNWFESTKSDINQKFDQLEGVIPLNNENYYETPGWNVRKGESVYPGYDELCKQLQCASPDTTFNSFNNVIKETSYLNHDQRIYELQDKQLKCANENSQIKQELNQCNKYLDKYLEFYLMADNPYKQPRQNYLELPSPQSNEQYNECNKEVTRLQNELNQCKYVKPQEPQINNNFEKPEFEIEIDIVKKIVQWILLPSLMTDRKAFIWKGQAPNVLTRHMAAFVVSILWSVMGIIILLSIYYTGRIVEEKIRKLLEESRYNRRLILERRKQIEREEIIREAQIAQIREAENKKKPWWSIAPGGAFVLSEHEQIDPIFLKIKKINLIKIKKINFKNVKSILKSKSKKLLFIKKLKVPRRQFLGYAVIGLVGLFAPIRVSNSLSLRNATNQRDSLEILYKNKNINAQKQIKVGDKILTLNNSTNKLTDKLINELQNISKINEINGFDRLEDTLNINELNELEQDFKTQTVPTGPKLALKGSKTASKRLARRQVMRLSDLPKLTDSNFEEFEEIITEIQQKTPYRVKNRLSN